jgi:hypothetical protein
MTQAKQVAQKIRMKKEPTDAAWCEGNVGEDFLVEKCLHPAPSA